MPIYHRFHDGFTGSGKNKKLKFKYLDNKQNPITDKKIMDYITSLVIPPMYNNVEIFYENKPKILFQGLDVKGRLQQIYGPEHKKKAMKKKFCNLIKFGNVLPAIKKDFEYHLKSTKPDKNKIISIILKIVMSCGFRLGNLKYVKLYNSFGIANIQKQHISMKGADMYIKFIGKKSVINTCIIKKQCLVNEINKLLKNKTQKEYVFTYIDIDGKNNIIKAIEINNYLKAYDPVITSKMFRTWDTNVLFIEQMRLHEDPTKTTIQQRKKIIIKSMKIISSQINNTPTIAKKDYLHVDLWNMYVDKPNKYKKLFNNKQQAITCFINYLNCFCK
jgi:DNA topoisomerase-1